MIKGQKIKNKQKRFVHGLSKTRPYNTWNHMMFRCYNKKDKSYKNYGGRGIVVCRKWHNFIGFWKDMKDTYKENLSIDRINNNGNYCKENCKWSTYKEQGSNRRTTINVFYKNREVKLFDLCKKLKVDYHMVFLRLFRYNWPLEKSLTQKSRIKLKTQYEKN